MCRQLLVSTSGYYAWCHRGKSKHKVRDERLAVHIAAAHAQSRETYGSPRIHRDLRAAGESVGRKRIARIIKENGLRGTFKRRFQRTTDSAHDMPVADNILNRRFDADDDIEAWVGDITYIRTWEGWLYLAVLINLRTRRVVGWAIDDNMRTELVLTALRMAISQEHPAPGLVHHSDRGSQYASGDYQTALGENQMVCSMSRRGNCWDNAVAESFFGHLKEELIYRQSWPTKASARAAVIDYIMGFYNSHRRHSALGYLSPTEYEAVCRMQALAA
jgi:putative transposase